MLREEDLRLLHETTHSFGEIGDKTLLPDCFILAENLGENSAPMATNASMSDC
jgi:hypothetical protein